MLAPIVTKDMRLFPTKRIPNVRSRAQSIDHIRQLQNSSSTVDRLVPVKPRISMSTGNISNGKVPTNRQKVGPVKPVSARSPPKSMLSRKTTLISIQEGVELTGIRHSKSDSSDVQAETCQQTKSVRNEEDEEDDEIISEQDLECSHEEQNVNDEIKKKRSVLRWITNTFRKSREKVSDTTSTASN